MVYSQNLESLSLEGLRELHNSDSHSKAPYANEVLLSAKEQWDEHLQGTSRSIPICAVTEAMSPWNNVGGRPGARKGISFKANSLGNGYINCIIGIVERLRNPKKVVNAETLVKTKSIQKKRNYICELIVGRCIHCGPYGYIAKGSTRSKQWPIKKQRLDNELVDEDDKEMDTFFEDIDRAVVLNKRGGIGINSGTRAGVCAELYIYFPDKQKSKHRQRERKKGKKRARQNTESEDKSDFSGSDLTDMQINGEACGPSGHTCFKFGGLYTPPPVPGGILQESYHSW
jgi:hypothetical protein